MPAKHKHCSLGRVDTQTMILLFYRGTKKDEDPIEQPEFWEDFPDEVLRDINLKEPLPEPCERSSIMQKLISLLQWCVLFMLLWQGNCKISDNGLEWLLQFLFQFLHLLGITCQCDYLVKFCTCFLHHCLCYVNWYTLIVMIL